MAVDQATDTVYVTNGSAGTVSVIDGATNTVTATIAGVGLGPTGVAVDDATDTVYVASSSGVAVIDGATNTVTGVVTGTQGNLVAVAVDQTTDTVYATNYHARTVLLIDGATNTQTATVAVDGLQPYQQHTSAHLIPLARSDSCGAHLGVAPRYGESSPGDRMSRSGLGTHPS